MLMGPWKRKLIRDLEMERLRHCQVCGLLQSPDSLVIYWYTGVDSSNPCSKLEEVIFRNIDWILKGNDG